MISTFFERGLIFLSGTGGKPTLVCSAWSDISLCYYVAIGGCKETGPGSGYCSHKLGHKIRSGLWLVTTAQYWPLIGRDCGRNVWVNNGPSLSVNSLFWDELWAKIGVTAQLFTRQLSQLLMGQNSACSPSDWLKLCWDKITLLNFNCSRAQEILEHAALYSVLCSYSHETVSQRRFNFENQWHFSLEIWWITNGVFQILLT